LDGNVGEFQLVRHHERFNTAPGNIEKLYKLRISVKHGHK